MDLKLLIKKILLAFEQSSTNIKYNKIYLYNDGPKKIKQITLSFGITEYGNLKKFLKDYCFKNGLLSNKFIPYIPDIGIKPLADNKEFIELLKLSSDDPIMKECQEQAFDSMYINPAYEFCSKNKLILNLSKLVICDSYLHSGSILTFLRNMFAEKIPLNGGDEKKWVLEYCKARKKWLETNSDQLLRKTVYRMNFMLDRIEKGDWDLLQSPLIANGVIIS